ncbi:MAG: hypothetical protein M3M85_01235 [bacterium]|nr:hypothetical protein [bacterium]
MKHLILIGYKSVGKSAIGRELAQRARMNFIDLDEEVERIYQKKFGPQSNCRKIMHEIGQDAFRELEHEALREVLENTSCSVISLGGGTPLLIENKSLLQGHTVIQITAPKNIVFERIMINGKPAFFPTEEHPLVSFNRTWKDRAEVYDALSVITVENSGSVEQTAQLIREKIH